MNRRQVLKSIAFGTVAAVTPFTLAPPGDLPSWFQKGTIVRADLNHYMLSGASSDWKPSDRELCYEVKGWEKLISDEVETVYALHIGYVNNDYYLSVPYTVGESFPYTLVDQKTAQEWRKLNWAKA